MFWAENGSKKNFAGSTHVRALFNLASSTVNSLIIDSEIYVTDWHNARDIPVSEGSFDIEDYTKYLIDYIRFLGPDINVIAICHPPRWPL